MASIEAEWIEWSGSCERPLNGDCLVDVCTKTYNLYRTTSDCVDWMSVISYRIHNAFKGAPDEATHLLTTGPEWDGVTSMIGDKEFAIYTEDCYLDANGSEFYVAPEGWQVIATRKREERSVTCEEHEALQSALESYARLVNAGRMADEQESIPEPVTAHKTVQAALKHMQDRAATYDKPTGERSMRATVEAFNAIAGTSMTEEQGWMFMALLKIVRSQQGEFKADNYEDLAAYAGLMAEAGATARPVEQERNK